MRPPAPAAVGTRRPLAGAVPRALGAPSPARLPARLLENGKVEFGLQQRSGGGWGEIILPRVNKFPYATTTVDQWRYSSPVTVAAAPAPAAGAWWRETAEWPHVRSIDWKLAGTGKYDDAGRAKWGYDAAPQLMLRCLMYSDGEPALLVALTAEDGYPYPGSSAGARSLRARVAGDAENRLDAIAWDTIFPFFSPTYEHAFMDWLTVNYARSPILHLDVDADGALYFRGTFDLTGLPAVLAGLPCYERGPRAAPAPHMIRRIRASPADRPTAPTVNRPGRATVRPQTRHAPDRLLAAGGACRSRPRWGVPSPCVGPLGASRVRRREVTLPAPARAL